MASKLADYRRNGVLADADFILFYADHGLREEAALREAFAIYANRPTAKVADALAWMLHSSGMDVEAWPYAKEAIGASDRDSSMLFHAGIIARSLRKDRVAARLIERALRLDPAFSLVDAPRGREALASL